MAYDKTGVMFTLPISCVGHAARLKDAEIKNLTEIFAKLAVAYQIRDDEADYLGNKTGRATSSTFLTIDPICIIFFPKVKCMLPTYLSMPRISMKN